LLTEEIRVASAKRSNVLAGASFMNSLHGLLSWRAFCAAIGVFLSYRGYRFITGMLEFKARAKADTCRAPPSFLSLPHGQSRPLQLFRLNDGVMGGKSSSTLSSTHEGVEFKGEINTNGGGFASFRTLGDEAPLGLPRESAALVVDATGCGQNYKMTLHTADSWTMSVPSWGSNFRAGARRKHRLPLKGFVASKQGRVVTGASLDAAEVTGMGFALSLYTADGKPNKQFGDGPFKLVVHSVEVVS